MYPQQYFSIVPYHHSENEYYFYIIFNRYSVHIEFIKGIFDQSSKSINFIESNLLFFPLNLYDYEQSFSCKLMRNMNDQTIINCIILIIITI